MFHKTSLVRVDKNGSMCLERSLISVFESAIGRRLSTCLGSEFFLYIRVIMVSDQDGGGGIDLKAIS